MFEQLERVKELDRQNLRARDLASKWTVLTREKESAERLVKSILDTLAKPDDQTELLMSIIEKAGLIDSRFMTSGSGYGVGVPGGMIVASTIREVAGQALTQATRMRASLDQRLIAARERLAEATTAIDRYMEKYGAEIESLEVAQ